jgi:hypothetical protein
MSIELKKKKFKVEKSSPLNNVVNCTPHDINVILEDGNVIVLPKSNTPARCSEIVQNVNTDTLDVPIVKKQFGTIENLPDSKEGTFYVVSAIIKAASSRNDLLLVNDTVRNENGVIVGCKSFAI